MSALQPSLPAWHELVEKRKPHVEHDALASVDDQVRADGAAELLLDGFLNRAREFVHRGHLRGARPPVGDPVSRELEHLRVVVIEGDRALERDPGGPDGLCLERGVRDRLERDDVPAAAAAGSEHGRCAERDSGDPDHSHGVTIGRASRSETLIRANVADRARARRHDA